MPDVCHVERCQTFNFRRDGGGPALTPAPFSPQLYLLINTQYIWLPQYRDPVFLHQKYVVEGLSVGQIADQIFSSKEAVRAGLLAAEIPPREPHLPHNGRQSQPR